jgi:ATP-binding cassette, subfamily B, bacterial
MRLAAALWRADRPMAAGWWGLLAARGVLPAGFAIATGVLVTAVERRSGLAAPLITVAVVFTLMQVLGPLHTALSANLGDGPARGPARTGRHRRRHPARAHHVPLPGR